MLPRSLLHRVEGASWQMPVPTRGSSKSASQVGAWDRVTTGLSVLKCPGEGNRVVRRSKRGRVNTGGAHLPLHPRPAQGQVLGRPSWAFSAPSWPPEGTAALWLGPSAPHPRGKHPKLWLISRWSAGSATRAGGGSLRSAPRGCSEMVNPGRALGCLGAYRHLTQPPTNRMCSVRDYLVKT